MNLACTVCSYAWYSGDADQHHAEQRRPATVRPAGRTAIDVTCCSGRRRRSAARSGCRLGRPDHTSIVTLTAVTTSDAVDHRLAEVLDAVLGLVTLDGVADEAPGSTATAHSRDESHDQRHEQELAERLLGQRLEAPIWLTCVARRLAAGELDGQDARATGTARPGRRYPPSPAAHASGGRSAESTQSLRSSSWSRRVPRSGDGESCHASSRGMSLLVKPSVEVDDDPVRARRAPPRRPPAPRRRTPVAAPRSPCRVGTPVRRCWPRSPRADLPWDRHHDLPGRRTGGPGRRPGAQRQPARRLPRPRAPHAGHRVGPRAGRRQLRRRAAGPASTSSTSGWGPTGTPRPGRQAIL